jgi:hypothetical protein
MSPTEIKPRPREHDLPKSYKLLDKSMRQNKESETMSDSTEAITVSRMTLLTLTGSSSQDPRARDPRA